MKGTILWLKTAAMILILLSTMLLLSKRGERELVVPHQPLAQFPETLKGDTTVWSGRPVGIDPQVIEILGTGDFTERFYQKSIDGVPVDLFIGYFPTQRTGVSIHSPKNCLPGSGWSPLESKYVTLSTSEGGRYWVNEYVIQKGEQKEIVLYWYQTHGRLVASEYAAKFYLVLDSIRLNRSDAALVRVITPILGNESSAEAEQRARQFAGMLMPALQEYIPS